MDTTRCVASLTAGAPSLHVPISLEAAPVVECLGANTESEFLKTPGVESIAKTVQDHWHVQLSILYSPVDAITGQGNGMKHSIENIRSPCIYAN